MHEFLDADTLPPVTMTPPPERQRRISHEALVLEHLRAATEDLGVVGISGMGAGNRFGIDGWGLTALQQFQYGDLRFEFDDTTIIVETESAGGVGNLVKYWPLLRSRSLPKRLVLLHVFMLGSDGDYIAHRKLWEFLVERMETDLRNEGGIRPIRWDAEMVTYRKDMPPEEVASSLRRLMKSALDSGGHTPA